MDAPDHVRRIAASYLASARGDAIKALHLAIAEALADLTERERRTRRAEMLVSRGYARGVLAPAPAEQACPLSD